MLGPKDKLSNDSYPMQPMAAKGDVQNFINYLLTKSTDECIIWPFKISPISKKTLSVKPKCTLMHKGKERKVIVKRYIYEYITNKILTKDDKVRNICNDSYCVNFNHLYIENIHIKGKWNKTEKFLLGLKASVGKGHSGINNCKAKLTERDINYIKQSTANLAQLMFAFEVCHSTIYRYCKHRNKPRKKSLEVSAK